MLSNLEENLLAASERGTWLFSYLFRKLGEIGTAATEECILTQFSPEHPSHTALKPKQACPCLPTPIQAQVPLSPRSNASCTPWVSSCPLMLQSYQSFPLPAKVLPTDHNHQHFRTENASHCTVTLLTSPCMGVPTAEMNQGDSPRRLTFLRPTGQTSGKVFQSSSFSTEDTAVRPWPEWMHIYTRVCVFWCKTYKQLQRDCILDSVRHTLCNMNASCSTLGLLSNV